MTAANIIVVGHEPSATKAVEEIVTRLGHAVCATASFSQKVVKTAGGLHPDLLLIDLNGNANGIEVAAELKRSFNIPAIYLIDRTDDDLLREAEATDPFGFVLKPIIEKQLDLNIRTALSMCNKESRYREKERELNRALAKAREESHLMRIIFENVSDGVVATDSEGRFLLVNRATVRIVGMGETGSNPEEWSETYGTFYPDGKRLYPSSDLPLVRAIRGESVDDVELLIRNSVRPNGVRITVTSRPLLDESGTNRGGIIVIRDITKLKETEVQLKERNSRLREQARYFETIINSVSDCIVAADENGEVTLVNSSARRFVGPELTKKLGTKNLKDWTGIIGSYYPDRVTQVPHAELPLGRAIRGESTDDLEYYVRDFQSSRGVYLSISGRPLNPVSNLRKGGVIVFRDITERMRAEQALLDAFSNGKLQILDTVVHNIGNVINNVSIGLGTVQQELSDNTPLRRLSYVTKALKAHKDDLHSYLRDDPQGQSVIPLILALHEDLVEQNKALIETTERVNKGVLQIVEIIRTERSSKTVSPVHKTIDLENTINESVRLFENSLRRRGFNAVVDCRNAPKEIVTQESQFRQMLANLIKNSIEAMDEFLSLFESQIEPRIEIRAYTGGDFLVLDITDNGVGIQQKHSRRIFTAGFSTKKSGTGLGLHSTANFVIAQGGKIQPLSAGIGKGTTMRIKLSLASVLPK